MGLQGLSRGQPSKGQWEILVHRPHVHASMCLCVWYMCAPVSACVHACLHVCGWGMGDGSHAWINQWMMWSQSDVMSHIGLQKLITLPYQYSSNLKMGHSKFCWRSTRLHCVTSQKEVIDMGTLNHSQISLSITGISIQHTACKQKSKNSVFSVLQL
jgi:hypothetical protein